MNIFYKFILLLQTEMTEPNSYGWFHLLCLLLTFIVLIIICFNKNRSEKKLKKVLLIYGVVALILELLKQISWSFNYDEVTKIVTWDYQWYSSAFQLCTMPIYISLIAAFSKDGKLRNALLSFMAFFTILGSICTMVIPDSCFTKDILVNIHTMYLHCGSFVVSAYLLLSGKVKLELKNIKSSYLIFLLCASIANLLNITIYQSGILHGETFNMFYISPYFTSILPIFDRIQESVPYLVYLLIYLVVVLLGGLLIFGICKLISYAKKKIGR